MQIKINNMEVCKKKKGCPKKSDENDFGQPFFCIFQNKNLHFLSGEGCFPFTGEIMKMSWIVNHSQFVSSIIHCRLPRDFPCFI